MIKTLYLSTITTLVMTSAATAGADAKEYDTTGYYQPETVKTRQNIAYGNGYRAPTRSRYVSTRQAHQARQQPRYAAAPRYAAPVQQQHYVAPPTQYKTQQAAAPVAQPRYVAPAAPQTYDYNKRYEGAIGTDSIEYDNEIFSPSAAKAAESARTQTRQIENPLALGAQVGTLGFGAEVSYKLNDSFTLRGTPSVGTYSFDGNEVGINYDSDLDLINLGLLADWKPFKSGFRVTGGAFVSGDEIEMNATNPGQIFINDINYNTAQVQSVRADVEFLPFQPYLGVGYNGGITRDNKWQFSVDVGAKYIGDADVSLSTVNNPALLASQAAFNNDVEQERRQLEDELSDYNIYPVVMVGAKYQF